MCPNQLPQPTWFQIQGLFGIEDVLLSRSFNIWIFSSVPSVLSGCDRKRGVNFNPCCWIFRMIRILIVFVFFFWTFFFEQNLVDETVSQMKSQIDQMLEFLKNTQTMSNSTASDLLNVMHYSPKLFNCETEGNPRRFPIRYHFRWRNNSNKFLVSTLICRCAILRSVKLIGLFSTLIPKKWDPILTYLQVYRCIGRIIHQRWPWLFWFQHEILVCRVGLQILGVSGIVKRVGVWISNTLSVDTMGCRASRVGRVIGTRGIVRFCQRQSGKQTMMMVVV